MDRYRVSNEANREDKKKRNVWWIEGERMKKHVKDQKEQSGRRSCNSGPESAINVCGGDVICVD